MKKISSLLLLIFSFSTQAHHSKNHMMLLEDTDQIISTTQQGSEAGLFWLLYAGVFILLLLGFIRWWKGRS